MAGWHGEDGAATTGDVRQSPPLLGLVLPDEPACGARLIIDCRPALATPNEDLPVLVHSRLYRHSKYSHSKYSHSKYSHSKYSIGLIPSECLTVGSQVFKRRRQGELPRASGRALERWEGSRICGLLRARPLCEYMLSHGGAVGAELSSNLGPVAGRAQLSH